MDALDACLDACFGCLDRMLHALSIIIMPPPLPLPLPPSLSTFPSLFSPFVSLSLSPALSLWLHSLLLLMPTRLHVCTSARLPAICNTHPHPPTSTPTPIPIMVTDGLIPPDRQPTNQPTSHTDRETDRHEPLFLLRRSSRQGAHSLRLHQRRLAHDLIRRSLDDAACSRQLRGDAHEVSVDVASGLATFVDAPVSRRVTKSR